MKWCTPSVLNLYEAQAVGSVFWPVQARCTQPSFHACPKCSAMTDHGAHNKHPTNLKLLIFFQVSVLYIIQNQAMVKIDIANIPEYCQNPNLVLLLLNI